MQKKKVKFAVLGAGNGGQAMAAHLGLMGYEVNLYNRTESKLEPIIEAGGIELSGVFNGFGPLSLVSSSLPDVISSVDVIMVVTPAIAHHSLAQNLSSYLQDGQIVVLNPGRTGGALEFTKVLNDCGCKADVTVSECQTFIYASRVTGPAQAKIFGIKNFVGISAFPASKTRKVLEVLNPVFPQFIPAKNILKTSLDNIGAIFHPAPTILNAARIETTGGNFTYYQDGISPSVARVLEKMDQERLEVAYTMSVEAMSAREWMRLVYGVQGKNLYEVFQNNRQYNGLMAPDTVMHRYIFEDVPMGLVPISSLGQMLGVPTPTIDNIIDLASIIHQCDYWEVGRTVERLGLEGLTVREIHHYVNHGILPGKRRSAYHLRKKPLVELDENLISQSNSYEFLNEGGREIIE